MKKNLITLVEIKEYAGMNPAVFAVGTIITPSARDWARDHQIRIEIASERNTVPTGGAEQNRKTPPGDPGDFLQQVVKTVVAELRKDGASPDKELVIRMVMRCLERLGCQVSGDANRET